MNSHPCVQSAFITPLEARRGEAVAVVAAARNLLITASTSGSDDEEHGAADGETRVERRGWER